MTRPGHTQASLTDLPASTAERPDGPRSRAADRAWRRPMTVRPFGEGYLVDCAGDTHYVSLDPSDCSCEEGAVGDRARDESAVRDRAGEDGTVGDRHGEDSTVGDGGDPVQDGSEPCDHVRRVAIEINLGRVPPPAERAIECAACGRAVGVSAADSPPPLCPDCRLGPGDLVVDGTTDGETPLLVVSDPGRPADLVSLPDERTVAAGVDGYRPDTPVVEVVYPHAVTTDRSPRRHVFPVARLRRPDPEAVPRERTGPGADDDPTKPLTSGGADGQ